MWFFIIVCFVFIFVDLFIKDIIPESFIPDPLDRDFGPHISGN